MKTINKLLFALCCIVLVLQLVNLVSANTSLLENTSFSYSGTDGEQSRAVGLEFMPYNNTHIDNVTVDSHVTCTQATIRDSTTNTWLSNSTSKSGNTFFFNYNVTANTNYYMTFQNLGGTCVYAYWNNVFSFPINNNYLKWVTSWNSADGNTINNYMDILNIGFTIYSTAGDTVKPLVNLVYPTSTTYNYKPSQLNFTASDNIGLSSCWYSINGGTTNTTTSCTANITSLTVNEGTNTWLVAANDTSNNKNMSIVSFTVDTIPPNISISYPLNVTYSYLNKPSELNFSFSSDSAFCWYSINGGTTNTTTSCNNVTGISISSGTETWIVANNDTIGNKNMSKVTFYVNNPLAPTYPVFTNYYDNSNTLILNGTALFNVTVTTTNNTVILQINNTNYTATSSGSVFNVSLNLSQSGTYNYTWLSWSSDSYNYLNNSGIKYYIVNTAPIPVISTNSQFFYIDLSVNTNLYLFILLLLGAIALMIFVSNIFGFVIMLMLGMVALTSLTWLYGCVILLSSFILLFAIPTRGK